jgi:3-hydroxybutyryl-CoA dehydratase
MNCTRALKVDEKLIHDFADVTGDHNPIHGDAAYAAKTRFGRCIAHGGILFGFISKVLGDDFPGDGTVWMSQEIRFKAPVFVNDTVTLEVTLVHLLPKNGAWLTTVITNQDGVIVANGTAEVKLPLQHASLAPFQPKAGVRCK